MGRQDKSREHSMSRSHKVQRAWKRHNQGSNEFEREMDPQSAINVALRFGNDRRSNAACNAKIRRAEKRAARRIKMQD